LAGIRAGLGLSINFSAAPIEDGISRIVGGGDRWNGNRIP
jgi:hypothetical protein